MKNWFLTLSILLIFPILNGQEKENELSNYFLLGLDYASNTSTLGVNINDVKQPYFLLNGSYLSKYNFDISYSAILTDNADSNFTKPTLEHNLGLGYLYEFSEKFMIYPSYTHLFHSENSYAIKSKFSDIAQLDFLYYTKYYNGSFSVSHLWGSNNMFYLSLQNAFDLNFEKFLHKNGLLNIQLGCAINLSDNNFYNKVLFDNWGYDDVTTYIKNNYSPRKAELILRILDSENFTSIKQEIYNNNIDQFNSDYRITTIDFFVPIIYSINNLMISSTGYITIPTATNDFYDQYTSFQFTMGFSYFFEL